MHPRRDWVTVAFAAILVACGSTVETTDARPGAGRGVPEEERGSRPGRRPDPHALEIRFEESGGTAGTMRVLTVNSANGVLDLQSASSEPQGLRVQPAELAQLVELVGGPGFAALKSRYGATAPEPGEPAPKLYRVVVTRRSEVRSVITEESAEDQPAVLGQALSELLRLRRLVDQLGS